MGVELNERTAVVTGAGRGLGREAALRLSAAGARVVLVSRTIEELQETEASIEQNGGTAVGVAADISTATGTDDVKACVETHFGFASILVNAAGVFGPLQPIAGSDPERWIETLAVNTLGPYRMCQAFAAGMVAQEWGRIVNYSSAAAFHPPAPLSSAYGTSKVALNQLTRHLAAELVGTGVTANVLHPGDVKTNMWSDIRNKAEQLGEEGEEYRSWIRWVDETGGDPPTKAADLVMKLVGDEAAGVTGQFLWISDGLQAPVTTWDTAEDVRPW